MHPMYRLRYLFFPYTYMTFRRVCKIMYVCVAYIIFIYKNVLI